MRQALKNFSYLRFFYLLFLIISFLSPAFIVKGKSYVPKINIQSIPFIQSMGVSQQSTPSPTQITHYSDTQIVEAIQKSRLSIDLDPFIVDQGSCDLSADFLGKVVGENDLTKTDLSVFCSDCEEIIYFFTQGNYNLQGIDSWMGMEDITKFTHDTYTHMCVLASDENALILLGRDLAKPIVKELIYEEVSILDFTDDQLWQALVDYRHAHTRSDLQYSTSLCDYASQRVEEHILMYEEKPESEYKNVDKYPLDSHEGFNRDGDSGHLFEVAGFYVVGENLAYWPDAKAPHQVIEWGWDTSTEGHREAQLSEEYSHACIKGRSGFYVTIFARN